MGASSGISAAPFPALRCSQYGNGQSTVDFFLLDSNGNEWGADAATTGGTIPESAKSAAPGHACGWSARFRPPQIDVTGFHPLSAWAETMAITRSVVLNWGDPNTGRRALTETSESPRARCVAQILRFARNICAILCNPAPLLGMQVKESIALNLATNVHYQE